MYGKFEVKSISNTSAFPALGISSGGFYYTYEIVGG
jgi:hypothetical protein